MPELVSGPAFLRLFEDFAHAAFRLEVRTSYGIPEEDEPYRQFLAGEDPGLSWFALPRRAPLRRSGGRPAPCAVARGRMAPCATFEEYQQTAGSR
ncbi:DUF6879 family protein [Streptomyces sp. NPDC005494]|uniref:DUF6879 family protein n=1 Tax=unclassified Streptomyces TaxID=2593676 RepID=UPI00369E7499